MSPLRVTVELVPHGIEDDAYVIGTLVIINTGDHPNAPEMGSYEVTRNGHTQRHLPSYLRSRGFWPLVAVAIQACAEPRPSSPEGS